MQLIPLVIVASDAQGNVVVGANVSIKTPAGAVVQLYNGAAWVNSVLTDARGMTPGVSVLPGDYVVTIAHASIGSITYAWTATPPKHPFTDVLPTIAASVDGDEIYFQTAAMAAADVYWHLRWHAATNRWYAVGAQMALFALDSAAAAVAGGGWQDRGPAVTTSYPGLYEVTTSCSVYSTDSGPHQHEMAASYGAFSTFIAYGVGGPSNGYDVPILGSQRAMLPGNTRVFMAYETASGTYRNRQLSVIPLYLQL
jgi:hypothetical protein